MSVKSHKMYILLLSFFVIATVDPGLAGPTKVVKDDLIIESLEELDDLNESSILRDSSSMSVSEPTYNHRDEDMMTDRKLTTAFDSLKYDVEILESNDAKDKADIEIEERYRGGPSIIINTDEFINENIEMNAADEEERSDSLAASHLLLSIILVVVALVSIALYAALVIWRSHIEQRYGMRELLVTSDNQDYWPQHMTDSTFPHQQLSQQQQQQSA